LPSAIKVEPFTLTNDESFATSGPANAINKAAANKIFRFIIKSNLELVPESIVNL